MLRNYGVFPVKMMKKLSAVLASSHDNFKIKTKLQNNHHWKSSKVQLNRSPTLKDIQINNVKTGRRG